MPVIPDGTIVGDSYTYRLLYDGNPDPIPFDYLQYEGADTSAYLQKGSSGPAIGGTSIGSFIGPTPALGAGSFMPVFYIEVSRLRNSQTETLTSPPIRIILDSAPLVNQ
jgi:hypothetical protein